MAILNYTTKVAVENSVHEIMKMLSKHGAIAIMLQNDDMGVTSALSFQIMTKDGPIGYTLPVNWEPILQIIENEKKVPKNKKNKEHAQCVAWRIMKDWIEAQLAIIQSNMVTLDQVMLPYARTRHGVDMYEYITKKSSILLPEADKNA